jgi:hypothetical protein
VLEVALALKKFEFKKLETYNGVEKKNMFENTSSALGGGTKKEHF